MPEKPSQRASYDENGDIVIGGGQDIFKEVPREPIQQKEQPVMEASIVFEALPEPEKEKEPKKEDEVLWEYTVEEEELTAPIQAEQEEPTAAFQEIVGTLRGVRLHVGSVASDLLEESSRQYRSSAIDSLTMVQKIASTLKGGARTTWVFLTQPVWIPGKRNTPKKLSRGTLFAFDILRFGGTFAALFLGLFFVLNYQSFWEIARANIDPLADADKAQELASEMDGSLAEKLRNVPSLTTAGRSQGHLLALLPPVGPPTNRLIIPKIGLNVPIEIPPTDALMREDWKTLEEEIQASLQKGVVHYPGTARPGQAGNFFVTGHSSYFPWDPGKFKSVFARLSALEVGDEYWVFYGGDKHRYIVGEKKEINPSDVSVLDQPVNKRVSTLMTCTPVGTTLRRLIITAQEVDVITGEPLEVGEHGEKQEVPEMLMEMLPI